MHSLGFIHRDIKPENVVINFDPLEAVVIDFDLCLPTNASTKASKIGTPGYNPSWLNVRDGKEHWDIWSLGAMILEANMPAGEYN